MKTYLYSSLLLLVFLFSCLGPDSVNSSGFPTHISNKETSEHKRILGTNVLLKLPKSYRYIANLGRYQKSERQYVQVMQTEGDINELLHNLTKENIEQSGAGVDIYQEITIKDLKGVFIEGPSKIEGETKSGIWFGNETNIVFIAGVYSTNDLEARREIIEILSSVYVKFEEEINNVQKIETITTLNFVMLDCGLFKNSLISHCKEWKYKFQMLLKFRSWL